MRFASCLDLKFKYSENASNCCEITTVDLSYMETVKSTVEILQNFVAFSEYLYELYNIETKDWN